MFTDRDGEILLWGIALLTFGILDTATTHYALSQEIASEANAAPAAVIETHGEWSLWLLKGIVVGLFYAAYRTVSEKWRVGIPIGLCVVGIPVLCWNLWVIGAV